MEEAQLKLMRCSPCSAVKVEPGPRVACRQNDEVERVKREMELWRAEARLLDGAGLHFIGREEKV